MTKFNLSSNRLSMTRYAYSSTTDKKQQSFKRTKDEDQARQISR